MAKYKVLKDFILNGVAQKEGDIIQLSGAQENLKSIRENIEKVPDGTPIPGQEGSALSAVKPGVPLTEEQKKKLAEENARLSAEANKQASDQLARDRAEGKGEPVVKNVAEALKDKLENGEFQKKENEPQPNQNQSGDGGQAN